jgi:hypothetical protein
MSLPALQKESEMGRSHQLLRVRIVVIWRLSVKIIRKK